MYACIGVYVCVWVCTCVCAPFFRTHFSQRWSDRFFLSWCQMKGLFAAKVAIKFHCNQTFSFGAASECENRSYISEAMNIVEFKLMGF